MVKGRYPLSNLFLIYNLFEFQLTSWYIDIGYSYPKGLILAFKLKKTADDGETGKSGRGKVDDTDLTKNNGASDATEKSSVENDEKITENKGNVSEEQADAVEELKGLSAGETLQSVPKVDKSPSNKDQDIISREDLKEEFTKFGTVRVIYIYFCFFSFALYFSDLLIFHTFFCTVKLYETCKMPFSCEIVASPYFSIKHHDKTSR